MFAGAHLQPVKTIPSLQIPPDWVMQFSLPLLLPFENEHAENGEMVEPTHSASREVIFLRGVREGNGGAWLVVRLVRWQGGVQGLIRFSDGGGSQQLSLFQLRLRLLPFPSMCPLLPISLSLIPTPATSGYPISFRCNYESFQGSFSS